MDVLSLRNNTVSNETNIYFNDSEYHFMDGELEEFLERLVGANKIHSFIVRKGGRIDLTFDMTKTDQIQDRDDTADKVKEFVSGHKTSLISQ